MATTNKITRIPVCMLVSTSTTDAGTENLTGSFAANIFCKGVNKRVYGSKAGVNSNAMNLVALIEAMKVLNKPCEIAVYTASNYVLSIANSWKVWRERNYTTKAGKQMANLDLWRELFNTCVASNHHLTFHYAAAYGKDELSKGAATEEDPVAETEQSDAIAAAKAIAEQVDPSVANMINDAALQSEEA